MWDSNVPNVVFGMTKKPLVVGDKVITGYGLSQADRVYDGQYKDSLFYWMENLGWGVDKPGVPGDKSIILVDTNYTLPPGLIFGTRMEKYLKWGYKCQIASLDPSDPNYQVEFGLWRIFLYKLLHQEGFYRGDVDQNGRENVADVIYKVNYLFKGGPKPIEFVDQMDVDNNHLNNVADVIYEINYLFKGGPAPIDRNRWLDKSPFLVDPNVKAFGVRNPGLFGDPNWKGLHP
jgi:hypothetical protein